MGRLLDRFFDWLDDNLGKVFVFVCVLLLAGAAALAWENHRVKTQCPVEPVCETRETTYYYQVGHVMMPSTSRTETCTCPAWETDK